MYLFVAGKWLQAKVQVTFSAVPGFPGNRQQCAVSEVLQRDCLKEGKNFSSNDDLLFDVIVELVGDRILDRIRRVLKYFKSVIIRTVKEHTV